MLYSKLKSGFFHPSIHGDEIPIDAIEISDERYKELMDGQASGKLIESDSSGQPVLSEQPVTVLTYAQHRGIEYPSIGDQLDALFKAGVFPADMAAKIQAVKDKYPKV